LTLGRQLHHTLVQQRPKRKVSGGSRSIERFKHTANLLTVVQTCRRQRRSVIDFFEQAIKAMVNPDIQEPSLIPQT